METDPLNKIICSGGLILAKDTKRFLLLLRTQGKTAGTWGLAGGKKDPADSTALETLTREVSEEVGELPDIKKIIPLELFTSNDQKFQYNTYVVLVEQEFIPVLNCEHSGYAWVEYNGWPMPLHRGVKNSLNNRVIKAKIELLLDLI